MFSGGVLIALIAGLVVGWWANNWAHDIYERMQEAADESREWIISAFAVVGFLTVVVGSFGLWRGWWTS